VLPGRQLRLPSRLPNRPSSEAITKAQAALAALGDGAQLDEAYSRTPLLPWAGMAVTAKSKRSILHERIDFLRPLVNVVPDASAAAQSLRSARGQRMQSSAAPMSPSGCSTCRRRAGRCGYAGLFQSAAR
jgi:hypothetical protein